MLQDVLDLGPPHDLEPTEGAGHDGADLPRGAVEGLRVPRRGRVQEEGGVERLGRAHWRVVCHGSALGEFAEVRGPVGVFGPGSLPGRPDAYVTPGRPFTKRP